MPKCPVAHASNSITSRSILSSAATNKRGQGRLFETLASKRTFSHFAANCLTSIRPSQLTLWHLVYIVAQVLHPQSQPKPPTKPATPTTPPPAKSWPRSRIKGSRVELNLAACSLYKKEAHPQRPHCGRCSFSCQMFHTPRYTAVYVLFPRDGLSSLSP